MFDNLFVCCFVLVDSFWVNDNDLFRRLVTLNGGEK